MASMRLIMLAALGAMLASPAVAADPLILLFNNPDLPHVVIDDGGGDGGEAINSRGGVIDHSNLTVGDDGELYDSYGQHITICAHTYCHGDGSEAGQAEEDANQSGADPTVDPYALYVKGDEIPDRPAE